MLLTKECLMDSSVDKYVQQLLLIGKGKDSYFRYEPGRVDETMQLRSGDLLKAGERVLANLKARSGRGAPQKESYESFLKSHNDFLAELMGKGKVDVKGKPGKQQRTS
jgi:hypothetical protein